MGEYNIQQFTPVNLESNEKCLLTGYSLLPNGRFYNPKTSKSFKYDHIKHTPYEVQHENITNTNESTRVAVQSQVKICSRAHPGWVIPWNLLNSGSLGWRIRKSTLSKWYDECLFYITKRNCYLHWRSWIPSWKLLGWKMGTLSYIYNS